MLDIKYIRENPEKVKEACKVKQVVCDIDRILQLDQERKKLLQDIEGLKAKQNKLGKADIAEAQGLKQQIKAQEPAFKSVEEELSRLLLEVPNVPLSDVPVGKDDKENKVIKTWGKVPVFSFTPKDHVALGQDLDLINTEKASTVTGARFAYLKREAALLEFALVQYVLSVVTSEKILKKIADSVEKGYSPKPFIPVIPPVMIRPDVFRKMGRLTEADKEERYYLSQDDLYLIGSAEHTLGPLHMDETLSEEVLPLRYLGFSTAFRREAGSYGKDMKGILRVHQFDKLEMESFTTPEDSLKEQNFFVAIQEYLMQGLELPYQVVNVCTGDMGKPDARQIDIETWLPGQGKYRETHSADLMQDFQARRLNIKVKRKDGPPAGEAGKTEFAHMNDATAFAIGRTLIAILENYQQKDGSIKIPKVLQGYLGKKVIEKH
jgi:seryl-tRNA synthetase